MKPEIKDISLFNPLSKDFEYEYFDANNIKFIVNLPSLQVTTLPEPLAHFMAKHLADEVMNNSKIKVNYDEDRRQALEEIYVK